MPLGYDNKEGLQKGGGIDSTKAMITRKMSRMQLEGWNVGHNSKEDLKKDVKRRVSIKGQEGQGMGYNSREDYHHNSGMMKVGNMTTKARKESNGYESV